MPVGASLRHRAPRCGDPDRQSRQPHHRRHRRHGARPRAVLRCGSLRCGDRSRRVARSSNCCQSSNAVVVDAGAGTGHLLATTLQHASTGDAARRRRESVRHRTRQFRAGRADVHATRRGDRRCCGGPVAAVARTIGHRRRSADDVRATQCRGGRTSPSSWRHLVGDHAGRRSPRGTARAGWPARHPHQQGGAASRRAARHSHRSNRRPRCKRRSRSRATTLLDSCRWVRIATTSTTSELAAQLAGLPDRSDVTQHVNVTRITRSH